MKTFPVARLALVCLSLLLPARAALPPTVAAALNAVQIDAGSVSLWAAAAGAKHPSWQHAAAQPRQPASVMKLLTTFAALDRLGAGYTWSTTALIDAPLKDGVLHGNLYLQGSGDPALSWERLGMLLRELRERGLREVRGDLVLERSALTGEDPARAGDFDGQPTRAYNATPDALMVNFNALTLRLRPAAGAVAVSVVEPLSGLAIDNQLSLASQAPCEAWKPAVAASFALRDGRWVLQLPGLYPSACGERLLHLAVPDSLAYADGVIRALWRELGGSLHGSTRSGPLPATATVLARWQSPPLSEVVRDINKFSNNVMARSLFIHLDTSAADAGRSRAGAVATLQPWLRRWGLEPQRWVLENGSGLSRRETSTAAEIGTLLQTAWRHPRMPEFLASLPLLGVDGNLQRPLAQSALQGRAYIKTGTLDGVRAAAGYLLDAQGRWQCFVWLVNDPRAEAAAEAFEAFLWALYGGAARR